MKTPASTERDFPMSDTIEVDHYYREVPDLSPGVLVDDSYEITGKLGEGGHSKVYSAIGEDGQSAAIKVPLIEDKSGLERVKREVDVTDLLGSKSRYVVNLLGAGTLRLPDKSNVPYMALGREAGTLRQSIFKRELSIEDRLEVVRGALAGLAVSHEVGIVHRDIKPDNMLRNQDGTGVLADFGIAAPAGSISERTLNDAHISRYNLLEALTQKNRAGLGTTGFRAPEILDPDYETDEASDIYSAGLTIATTALGNYPWKVYNNQAMTPEYYEQSSGIWNRATVEAVGKTANSTLAGLVDACTERKPKNRPNVHEVVGRLAIAA